MPSPSRPSARLRRFMCMVLASVAVAACSHVPVTSLPKLAAIDFKTTDPNALLAGIELPQVLRPKPEGVSLELAVRLDDGEERAERYVLRERGGRLPDLPGASDGNSAYVYGLTPADAQRLAAFRSDLLELQKTRHGSLSIMVHADACRTGPVPDGPLRISTYLSTSETTGFVPLARNVDLRELGRAPASAELPECV